VSLPTIKQQILGLQIYHRIDEVKDSLDFFVIRQETNSLSTRTSLHEDVGSFSCPYRFLQLLPAQAEKSLGCCLIKYNLTQKFVCFFQVIKDLWCVIKAISLKAGDENFFKVVVVVVVKLKGD